MGLKTSIENYLQIFSKRLLFIIFRMFNVYGPDKNGKFKKGMMSIYLFSTKKKKK